MNTRTLAALAILALPGISGATAPNALTYQGRLTESGSPVTGSRTIGVRLCDAVTGGTCYDAGSQSASVQNGVFRVVVPLATTPPLPTAGLAGGTWFIEISVNATTLTPREQLTSSAYAVYASSAETLSPPSATSPGVTISTNVGIGTAPSAPLHVMSSVTNGARVLVQSAGAAGNPARLEVRGSPAGSGGQVELNKADATGVSFVEFQQASSSRWQLRHETAINGGRLDVAETVNGTPTAVMTAAVGGRVGVGATSPTARLHVSSASATSSDAIFKASSGTALGQEILTVAGDGYVGVGATSPQQIAAAGPRLEVNGPANVVGQLSVNGGSGFSTPLTVNGTISLSGALNLVGAGSSLTNTGNGGINPGSGGITSAGNITVTGAATFSGDGSGLSSVVRLVSSSTLTGASNTMTLGLPTNMRYLRVLVRVAGLTASGNLMLRFNGDSGGNYAFTRMTGATQTTGTSASGLTVFSADYGTSAVEIVVDAPNNGSPVKAGMLQALDYSGATTAPSHVTTRWVWADVGTPIGSVTVIATNGSMLAGTSIAAYGSN